MKLRSEVNLFSVIVILMVSMTCAVMVLLPPSRSSGVPKPFADPRVTLRMLAPPGCHIDGPPSAPFTLVAFVDLQCPNCRQAHKIIDGFMREHPGQMRIVTHHYRSTRDHVHEPLLAYAAESAGRQGKFRMMCAAIFARQNELRGMDRKGAEELVAKLARQLGLDIERFSRDRASAEVMRAYEADLDLARRAGVTLMPGFFFVGPHGHPVRLYHLMQMKDWLSDPSHWRRE